MLKGIGVPRRLALSSLRLSIGRFTSNDDIDRAGQALRTALIALRQRAMT